MRLPRFGSLFLAVALLTVAACDSKTEAPRRSTAASGTTADGVRYRVVAEKLNAPWGAAFLPNGTALVTERNSHKILAIKPDGTHSTAQTVPDVKTGGEGGLLGIAVSPR